MKILFTGSSSFTGMWFVKELVKRGHQITATFCHLKEHYTDLREKRMNEFLNDIEAIYQCPFGSDHFIHLLKKNTWDILCHHGAEVRNYKNNDFDAVKALQNNTQHIYEVMKILQKNQCHKILLTGSVFEPDEGAGSDNLIAVSPYGLSKGLTFKIFEYYCKINDLKLGKFVIPNPFGPFEEAKLTYNLMEAWHKYQIPSLKTPYYVRDNVPVSLLAKVYADFLEQLTDAPGLQKINPSGYVESLENFTLRLANEMKKRLPWRCEFEIEEQRIFIEPGIRINTDIIDRYRSDWNEELAWNELASYYNKLFNG